MAHLVLFTDANFGGSHKHIFDEATQLSLSFTDQNGNRVVIDGEFPDGVSSIAIFSGNWQFFRGENLESPLPAILGPGLYSFVGDVKLPNDSIRSMTTVTADPNMFGAPLDSHTVLFEHAQFHGPHQHVFQPVTDLGDFGFSQITSSIVVESGNWTFFGGTQFDGSYPGNPVFGPGIYPWVAAVGIQNDDIASLQPTTLAATFSNAVDDEVLLFQYGDFFGPHKHVVAAEPNLNASDDDDFNDRVNSLAILAGDWSFYSDADFTALYNTTPAGPGPYPDLATLTITPDDVSSLRPAVPQQVTAGQGITGEVILFTDGNFAGQHRHVLNAEPNLDTGSGVNFNDAISSIVVVSGNWKFFRNPDYDDDYPVVLGPGSYPSVTDVSISNDDMSSLTVVDDAATVTGAPLDAHIILFANAAFHGDHKHVVQATADLNAGGDPHFGDVTSSIAVISGVWDTFADPNFESQFPPRLGPGLYPGVTQAGLANDQLSSLQPVKADPTTDGDILLAHIVLFTDADLRGPHKHVFVPEPNLNASDDDSFNDAVSSVAVLLNQWFTYRDAGFDRAFDVTLGEGLFPWVEDVSIANDAMSSLQIAQDRLAFAGVATINVASGQLPDPVLDPLGMGFLFDPATRDLQIETAFADLPLASVATMHFDSAGIGSFPPDGQVMIPDMKITLEATLGSEDVTVTLSTGTASSPTGRYIVNGSPADAAGNVTLVAAGQVAGDDFSISIAGVFTPRPA
jgi:Beta/Gamma crystallin